MGGVREDGKVEVEVFEGGSPIKKKAKKEKKVKDPLAPKKPATAYLLFFHSMKAEVKYLSIFCVRLNFWTSR